MPMPRWWWITIGTGHLALALLCFSRMTWWPGDQSSASWLWPMFVGMAGVQVARWGVVNAPGGSPQP